MPENNGDSAVQKAENKLYIWLISALLGAVMLLGGTIISKVFLGNDANAQTQIDGLKTQVESLEGKQNTTDTNLTILNGNVWNICQSLRITCINPNK
jgi:hypothetical protein